MKPRTKKRGEAPPQEPPKLIALVEEEQIPEKQIPEMPTSGDPGENLRVALLKLTMLAGLFFRSKEGQDVARTILLIYRQCMIIMHEEDQAHVQRAQRRMLEATERLRALSLQFFNLTMSYYNSFLKGVESETAGQQND